MSTIHLPPPSSGFYMSLRGNSHTLATALADLVDNSYSAGAENVWIAGLWNVGYPIIEVLDDGSGMSREDLINKAMMFAAEHRLRVAKDLGKFGLGLKYAAFSQGQCLTVITKKNGVISCARWDGEALGTDWSLQVDIPYDRTALVERLDGLESGTLVRISAIDRIGPTGPDAEMDEFMSALMETEQHLATTFNRLIGGGLNIHLGRRVVDAVDPVYAARLSTQHIAPIYPKIGKGLKIEGFAVSPDLDLPPTEQGIYVYRNNRLIAQRGYAGLSTTPQHDLLTRLARIVINISPDDDMSWGINVEKSCFRVPSKVKPILRDYIETVQTASRNVLERKHGRSSRARKEPGNDLWVPTGIAMEPHAINYSSGLISHLVKGRSGKAVREALAIAQKELPPYQSMKSITPEDVQCAADTASKEYEPEAIDDVACNIPSDSIENVKALIALARSWGDSDDEISKKLASRLNLDIEPRLIAYLAGPAQ